MPLHHWKERDMEYPQSRYEQLVKVLLCTSEKQTPQRPITEEEKILEVFDHQIHQKLATDMKFSGFGMEVP